MGSGRWITRMGSAGLAALALAAPATATAARTTARADDFRARASVVCRVEMGAVNRQIAAAKTAAQQSKQLVGLARALRRLSTGLSAPNLLGSNTIRLPLMLGSTLVKLQL